MRARSHAAAFLLAALAIPVVAPALDWQGQAVQGGLIVGTVAPGATVTLDGRQILVSREGNFVIGFGRDDTATVRLEVHEPGSAAQTLDLTVQPRTYQIERIDGLPPRSVTPDPESLERIRLEGEMVANARGRRENRADYATGFIWPAQGRLSGFYGSQRVLNGEPRRPHYGVDIAAPEGTLVVAPADGVVTLTHPDMYFSGGTVVLDHGQGLSSSFLHLSEILVATGDRLRKGDPIGRIGMTGRASGPHLDWRMNWLDKRIDPQVLVKDAPLAGPSAGD